MRIHLDSGRNPKPHRLRPAAAVREPRKPLDVVGPIDDEAPDARLECAGDLVVRFGVAVQLHPRYREAGSARRLKLPQRRDARVDALAGDDRTDPDQRARLDGVRHPDRSVTKESVDVLPQARPDRLGVVDVEGRAVTVGQRRNIVCPDTDVPVAADDGPERPDRALDHAVRSSVAARPATTR